MPEEKTQADTGQQDPATEPDGDAAAETEGDDGTASGGSTEDPARQLRNAQSAAKRAARDRDKLKAEVAAMRAQLDKQKPAEEAVDPKAIAEAAKAEARAEVLKDRAKDKIEVMAAKKFANPDLAVRLLAGSADEFTSGGKIDTEAIQDALDELLEANPYLAVQPEKRFKGSADQGVRTGKEPSLDAQIAAAQKAGDVREQIRLQNLKMLPHIQKMVSGQA